MVMRRQTKNITQMYKKGLTDLEIAAQIGIKPGDVYNVRKKNNLLTAEEKLQFFRTRRNLIKGGIATIVIAAVGGVSYLLTNLSTGSITYENTLRNIGKRQDYIDQIVASKLPDYVISVEYATPKVLEELASVGYTPPTGAFAATVPMDINYKGEGIEPASVEHIGKGSKSKIYVFQSAFYDLYEDNPELNRNHPKPELYNDFEIIMSGVILNNEFTDAKHFNQGIPGYPLELFKDSAGDINHILYSQVIDILSNAAEYNGLSDNPRIRSSEYLQFYAIGLTELANGLYDLLSDPVITANMDKQFMDKLKQDFNPAILFHN